MLFSDSKSDESDNDDDRRYGGKIHNLTDILSTPSSGFHKYEHQKKESYVQPSTSSDEKSKTKDRYYIYNIRNVDDDAEEINRDDGDKSRKIRSSTLSDRKQVSRNISMVLENLLKSYENSQLPTHGQGLLSRLKVIITDH